MNSELYKGKIIEYLEARDYFIVATSDVESIFADIKFRHRFESIENWMEVKDTKVSLNESKFIKQLAEYLEKYLNLSEESRFRFWLAATEIISNTFKPVFDDLDGKAIKSLTERMISVSDVKTADTLNDADFEDIKKFYETSTIVVGDPRDFLKSKEKIIPEAPLKPDFDDVEYANEILNNFSEDRLVDQEHLGFVNLFPVKYPDYIYIATSPYKNPMKIYSSNPLVKFPIFHLENKKLYTFDNLNDSILRKYVNIHTIDKVKTRDWFKKNDVNINIIQEITRRYIKYLCKNKNMRYEKRTGVYHYSKPKGYPRELKIEWVTPKNINITRTITKPYFKKDDTLNFWSHKSVRIVPILYIDNYYLRIFPRWIFSEDGFNILEGVKADKLDRYFRKSIYNRNKNKLYDLLFWYYHLFRHTTKDTPDTLTRFFDTNKYRIEILNCVNLKLYKRPDVEVDEIDEEEDIEPDLNLEYWMDTGEQNG